jgi:class 3 adenylate cyclase
MRMNLDVDVCSVLPSIRVPTLILHRTEVARLDVRGARYLAQRIPGARLVELPGRNLAPAVGDPEALLAELRVFFDQVESGNWRAGEPDRVLATVLFTDIVDSTALAAELSQRSAGRGLFC